MAMTVANDDISVIGQQLCVQENLPVDDLSVHALALSATTGDNNSAVYGDTVKVPIYSATGDATEWNSSTNNYSTIDGTQSVTFKDVVINQRYKKTIEIDEMDLFKVDVAPILRLELENVARTMVDIVNADITVANFATSKVVGAVGAFDSDVVIDVRAEDQVRQYPQSMRKLAMNVPYSIALQKDPAIKNHNTLTPVGLPSNYLLTSFAKFDGGLFELEQLPTAENLVGIATNGCGLAIATPAKFQGNDPDTSFDQTIVSHNGFNFLLRRTKVVATGAIQFTIEAQWGSAVADELGITRLTSA